MYRRRRIQCGSCHEVCVFGYIELLDFAATKERAVKILWRADGAKTNRRGKGTGNVCDHSLAPFEDRLQFIPPSSSDPTICTFLYRKRLKKVAKREAKERWDDRHWSDKSLEEMTERDWRIFKEDYNISTKGGCIPNALRKWGEAELPGELKDVIEQIGYKVECSVQFAQLDFHQIFHQSQGL